MITKTINREGELKEAVKQILLSMTKERDLYSYYNKCMGNCEDCCLNNFDVEDFIKSI